MDQVTLQIATPKGVYTDTFPKTEKVQDVIKTAISKMKLDGGDSFELVYNNKVLQPVERPLVSFGIEGTVKLELVATGRGV